MIPKETQERLDAIARKYAVEIRRNTMSALQKYRATGRLLDSVKVEIQPAGDAGAPVIVLTVEDYATVFEARNPLWTRMPPLRKLLEWSQSQSLELSSRVPGYANGAPNLPPYKRVERILWAIAIDKRKNDTWKRRPWRKKSLSQALRDMNAETFRMYEEEVQREIDKAAMG